MKAAIYTALKTACDRVFPVTVPYGTPAPYIVYQGFGGEVVTFLDNADPQLKNRSVQVRVWGADPAQADSVLQAASVALQASTGLIAKPMSAPRDDYDEDMQLYSASQDFTIWTT